MSAEHHYFFVRGHTPPTVEVDSEASAVYVRFKRAKVAKTVPRTADIMHIAVDLDSNNEVVGIEAVGITSFSLKNIFQWARVKTPDMDFSRAQYKPAAGIPA